MDSFIEMRKFLLSNQQIFSELNRAELKQLEPNKKLEKVFNYIASNIEIKQKIFFDVQIYDAFCFIISLVEKAQKKLILIFSKLKRWRNLLRRLELTKST